MEKITISLSKSLKEFVDDQVGSGLYKNQNEYFREVIRRDRVRWAEEHVEALIQEGLATESTPLTPECWARIRAEGMRILEERRAARDSAAG